MVDSVSAAVFESQQERMLRIVKYIILGWAATAAVALCVIFGILTMPVGSETSAETTTIEQDADGEGSNSYTEGDSIGEANYYQNQDNYEDSYQDGRNYEAEDALG